MKLEQLSESILVELDGQSQEPMNKEDIYIYIYIDRRTMILMSKVTHPLFALERLTLVSIYLYRYR